jgi:predicted 2-oxoglutarate/Fe(II)-dependent dioxygenase YbiX
MPRTRGTLVVFPGWTVHEVEPVTAGERWALIVNGWGPPLR